MTLERLKFEGRMFRIRASHYKEISDPAQAFRILAENIEQIVADHKTEFSAASLTSCRPHQTGKRA